MAPLNKKTAEDYFGLDIGTTGIRLVQMQAGHEKPSLVTYAARAIPADLITGDSEVDKGKLADLIRQLQFEANASSDRAVLALPAQDAVMTVLQTPRLETHELGRHIRSRAAEFLSMPVTNARLDWHIISDEHGDESEQSVLVVAADERIVMKYQAIMSRAGLELMALEVDILALTRSLISPQAGLVVAVDLGSTASSITAVWHRIPRVMQVVHTGGETFTRSLGQNLNVDVQQARQFLQEFGVVPTKLEGRIPRALEGQLSSLTGAITQTVEACAGSTKNAPVEKIVLTGGPAAIPGLPAYLADQLHLPVEVANPWSNVSYPAAWQDALMSHSLQFGVAAGLAQRSFA